MKAEREKIHAKVKADTVRLNGSKLELTADEETCTFLLVSEGSCTLQMGRRIIFRCRLIYAQPNLNQLNQ